MLSRLGYLQSTRFSNSDAWTVITDDWSVGVSQFLVLSTDLNLLRGSSSINVLSGIEVDSFSWDVCVLVS